MNLESFALAALLLIVIGSTATAAVLPLDKPAMAVTVEVGKYTVRGHAVTVAKTTQLSVAPPDRVQVKNEEHVLSDEKPTAWARGTSLQKTLGPVDTGTRLLYAIDPASVKVHAADQTVYEESKDYFLDHDWGGMSRIDGGKINKSDKVSIDYEVTLERIDAIQVSKDGIVSLKKGKSAPICPVAPSADPNCTVICNIYLTYRTNEVTKNNLCPMPEKDITWKNFVKVSGREHLSHTLGLLKENKPVTVVCWGDSVTEGGSPSRHELCYVELFRSRLEAAYPKSKITLINAGIGGSNTNSRRDGYEKEVLSYNPDLVTVEFVNDCGLPLSTIKANWDEFITRARQKNPDVEFILITPHFTTPAWMGGFNNAVNAMRKAADDNGVALADASNIWANLRGVGIPYETLLANGLNHPNDLGHNFFATSLMELMAPGK